MSCVYLESPALFGKLSVSYFEVVQKNIVVLPSYVEGVVRCINSNCISNSSEPIKSKFSVLQSEEEGVTLRCLYCEHVISENIAENLR